MVLPLLHSKLFVPRTRPSLVPRPRLFERLNDGRHRKLSLISAPAGFGKTTLVSGWVATTPLPVAWLSLDEGDNEPPRFLAYLVGALQTLPLKRGDGTTRVLGEGLPEILNSAQPPPAESIITTLLNEIASLPDDFVLVLDDYHLIDSPQVDHTLCFLLDHMPPQMHLMMTTREDPQLPLARLRVRGEMTEVRVADLRFTHAEAASFLTRTMHLALSTEDIATLEKRTEGWIAGLQMAALSMQGREDTPAFIRAFAGDHRYIVDYLVEEVLERQPPPIRTFLLQTSLLDRLNGSLCDAITNQEGSGVLLEALERDNLFVVPLDDRRRWYRYHHLFADVLRAHVLKEQSEPLSTLHQRASDWYAANGEIPDAVRHALAAEQWERAAELIERAWSTMDQNRQSATWLRWAQALPQALFPARPVLSVGYAWALLDSGALEAAGNHLLAAERWVDEAAQTTSPPESSSTLIVADEAEFRLLPATIASARAYRALALGNVSDAVEHALHALDFLPEEEDLRRGIVGSLLGLALWIRGELEQAHHTFAEAMARFERMGNTLFAITGTYILADIRLAQGRLHDAIRTYEQALQLAEQQEHSTLRGTAELHLGLSELRREQGDVEAATHHLRQSEAISKQFPLPRWKYHWCLAQARLKEEQGEPDAALALLDEAEKHFIRGPVPVLQPIAALRARVWIAQGKLAEAEGWVRAQGLSVDDNLIYPREFEYITFARVLLAQYQSAGVERAVHEAIALLKRLLHAADTGGRGGSMLDILVLLALAHEAQGNLPEALLFLERGLTLAEPEGFIRCFVREGSPMARLLAAAAARGMMPAYTRTLLAALGDTVAEEGGQPGGTSSQPLIEPLSERELEVLRLVAQGLSNREIGERLFLALDTVKGHNRNIFGKLQVRRRTEAVAYAQELGLL